MSTYLYTIDRNQLTHSTSLSRLILALVHPFTHEANEAFLAEATAKRDAEVKRLLAEGARLGFGSYDIDDPLEGWTGVRGKAFVLADIALPQELDDALLAQLSGKWRSPDEVREDFPEARRFIAAQAVAGTDILVD